MYNLLVLVVYFCLIMSGYTKSYTTKSNLFQDLFVVNQQEKKDSSIFCRIYKLKRIILT